MPDGIMEGFFKKINQKVTLGWHHSPDTRPNVSILKDTFLKKKKKILKIKIQHVLSAAVIDILRLNP